MVTVYSHKHNYTKTISLLSIVFVKCVHLYPPCKLCKLLLTHLLCCVFKLVVTACRRLPQSLLLVVKKTMHLWLACFFFKVELLWQRLLFDRLDMCQRAEWMR